MQKLGVAFVLVSLLSCTGADNQPKGDPFKALEFKLTSTDYLTYNHFDETPIRDSSLAKAAKMMSKAFLVAKSTPDNLSTVIRQETYFVDDTTKDAYINVLTQHRYVKDTSDHFMVQTLDRRLRIIDGHGL